ncbi:hypothetical protein TRAPUB_9199 [Trametes pubescens]|uniref:Uncharacterized protein n=1 Tax=Trametes pubescens TaxID=154538 RepID=A0A1M2W315_TRAPU|nr:hypothetical protein TRAPUB_9199 [Trametes pubescens]
MNAQEPGRAVFAAKAWWHSVQQRGGATDGFATSPWGYLNYARAVSAEEADSLQRILQRDNKRACENFALCCVEKDEVNNLSESMGESSEDTLEYMLRSLSVEFECGAHGALQVHTDIRYDDAAEAETSGHTSRSVGSVADRKEELARAFGAQEFLQRDIFRRNGNEFVFTIRGSTEDSERAVVRIPAGWDPSDDIGGQSACDSRLLKDETQGRKEGEEEGASNMHLEN